MDLAATEEINHSGKVFRGLWPRVTDDSNATLHSFRRFKTSHLLNLRFLEQEIAGLDHIIYQAGLSLGHEPSPRDRLGLKHSSVDPNADVSEKTITREVVLKLRNLVQQYDGALVAFGHIMAMETTPLLEDETQWHQQTGLTLSEKYNTRLIRVDLGPRSRADPLQRWLHKKLRAFRFWSIAKHRDRNLMSFPKFGRSRLNTVLIASIAGRMITTCIVGLFLVVPLTILSAGSIRGGHLAVICVSIALFAAVVSAALKVSNYEMMATSAAYAAVLSVFVSNGA